MTAAATGRAAAWTAAQVRARLIAQRVVPVLRLASAELTLRAVRCLREAGFEIFEITLTTPDACEVIRELARSEPPALVGAGTVLDAGSAQACIDAGAAFLVSPCLVPGLTSLAHEAHCAALIGAFTPTEVLAAHREGADIVKVFPASSAGPAHLAALRAVFPQIALCPTGGVDAGNMAAYFAAGAALVGVGNAIVDAEALAAGDLDRAVARARSCLQAARSTDR